MNGPRDTERFRAIGTTVTVVVADPAALGEATAIVREHIDQLDRAASRFRGDSELAGLHAASGRPVAVSPLLRRAVEESLAAAELTGGIIDPTVGEALVICGFDRDFDDMEPGGPPLRARLRPVRGWRQVRIDPVRGTVRVPRGVLLDLGATAKAGCADRAAEAVARATRCGVLVNLGGDLAVAGQPPAEGWSIRIADRHDEPTDGPGVNVAIASGGLATSGTAARRWSRGGTTLHHLIDPATGAPADSCWRTASVVADTCLNANIASTSAIILGPSAPAWLESRGFPARLVGNDAVPRFVGGWPCDLAPSTFEAMATS
ncbi:MAG TPA: FAD:protein FMN transferase [Acidimicrobiales bacterium]